MQTLCLEDYLRTVTDGTVVLPACQEEDPRPMPCKIQRQFMDLRHVAFDPLHADATAVYYRIACCIGL